MQAPPLPPGLSSLMDKIRGKAAGHRGWPELVKMTKAALVDKRSILVSDASERPQVEKCLDTIQKSIRVTGLRSMIERLETITRQLGLKFTAGPTGKDVFISSDMFYVEVVLDPATGYVNDVKVAHQADPVSCPELTNVLRASDFAEFMKHMEGIAAIYQLTADSKQKSKAYMSLHCLETDLSTLAKIQSYVSEPINIIHKTPVGILEPRKGGHAMKLTFFVSPYDLIDRKTKSALPLNIETVTSKKLGYSANVCIESSTRSHKLQTKTLTTVQPDQKNMPLSAAFSNLNSTSLPACFVLKLVLPLPVSIDLIRTISSVTAIDFVAADSLSAAKSLVHLVALNVLSEKEREKLPQDPSSDCSYFARLPDQEHVYFVHQDMPQLRGVTVSSIPFTHPTHVPQILVFLRQQVLFNVVIGSCMRKVSSFGTSDPKFSFEITTQNLSHISVSFEHPVEESLASLEIDLTDITNVKCKLYDPSSFASLCSDDFVSKIMQRSLSIPVTLRMVIVKTREKAQILREQEIRAQQQQPQQQENNDLYQYNMNANDQGMESTLSSLILSQQFISNFRQNSSSNNNAIETAAGASAQQQQPQTGDGKFNHAAQQLQSVTNCLSAAQKAATQALIQNLQHQQQNQTPNQILQRQLSQPRLMSNGSTQQQIKQNAMLLNMLSDIPAANQPQAVAAAFTAYQQQQQQQSLQNLPMHLQQQLQQQFELQNQLQKQKKVRKRKNGENTSVMTGSRSPASSTGRSPKRKVSEDDFHPRDVEMMDACSARPAPNFDVGSGPRSLEQLLTGLQTDASSAFLQHPAEIPNDLILNLQLIQRSMSAAAASGMEPAADSMDFDQADFVAKLQGKKRTSRTRSSDEDELVKHQMTDVTAYPSLMRSSSVGPLPSHHQQQLQMGKGKLFPTARNTSAGDPGRRCSSAGVGEGNRNRSPFGSANSLISDPASMIAGTEMKKDKKRKRSESVDSSMKSAASVSLMPPPLISSTGDMSASILMSPVAGADPNSPALRNLTMSVKPMLATSSSDPVRSPGSSAKKLNAVSSSASGPSQKTVKSEKSKSLTKLLTDAVSVGPAGAPGQSKLVKAAIKLGKNGPKIVSAGPKFKQGTGMRMKASQVTSSSSSPSPGTPAKQVMSLSGPPVSSSSSTPGSVSPSVGVSSTKSGTQLLKQLQQQQQQQISGAAAAAAAVAKKPKGILSAVIDKLSKSMNPVLAPGESASTSSPPSEDISGVETTPGPSSRPDSSSSEKSSPLAKAAAASLEKGKYSRPAAAADNSSTSAQTTYKTTLSGSKLTISKKPTSSTESGGKAGVKMKTTPAAPMNRSPASSSSPSSAAKVKGTNLLKKHTTSGFKSTQKSSSSVSSSSSSSSSSLLSTPPKQNAGRTFGSGKVSSSQAKDKISSTCRAGAILQEAIGRVDYRNLPKIPKTDKAAAAAAAQATAAAAAATSTATLQNPAPLLPATTSSPPLSSQPSSSVTTPPVMAHGSQPFFRRPGPAPRVGDQQQSVPASTTGSSVLLSDRFQSNAITSSHVPSQNQETLCSSSSLLPDVPQVPPVPLLAPASSSASIPDAVGSSGSGNTEKGVSSSSDADPDEPTSTPSSPVESVVVSEANPPPIIPTESFDDNERSRIDSTENDSEIGHSIYSAGDSAAGVKEGCCSSTAGDDDVVPSKDEEDDEDGLVIDVDYSAPTPTSNTPSSRKETPTPGDPVSSSNAPSSQPSSAPSSPSSNKSPAAGAESSSLPVTPSASSSALPWSSAIGTAPESQAVADAPSAETGSISPPAPVIDDDLMDEALVGSDEQAPAPVPAPAIPIHHVHEPEPEL